MLIEIIKISGVAVLALLLNACVSVTETRYSKNANPEKAAETYVALAVGYLSQGNMVLARQKIDRAMELNPENPSVHSALAVYWLERGEVALSEKAFLVALDLDENHSPTNYHYGLYLMGYKRDKRACDHLSIAAKDVDYSARFLANESLGLCFLEHNDESQAINAFEKAWLLDGDSTVSSLNLSRIFLKRKRIRLANNWFKRFEKTLSDNEVDHSAGSLHVGIQLAQALGNKDSAHSYGFKLKKRFPQSVEYKSYLSANKF
jgi:type IV pilus assembly protein PilF